MFIPWFVPALLISAILAMLVGPTVARWLRVPLPVAVLLVASAGAVVSATLTPIPGPAESLGSCDFRRVGPAPLWALARPNEISLNVLLFVPLGIAVGMLPRTRRGLSVLALAVASPLLVEATQALVPVLGRGCQSADVVDNLTGLILAWMAVLLVGWAWHQLRAATT
jgi:hypothetical protein